MYVEVRSVDPFTMMAPSPPMFPPLQVILPDKVILKFPSNVPLLMVKDWMLTAASRVHGPPLMMAASDAPGMPLGIHLAVSLQRPTVPFQVYDVAKDPYERKTVIIHR